MTAPSAPGVALFAGCFGVTRGPDTPPPEAAPTPAPVDWEARRWEAALAALPEAVNDYGEPTMGNGSKQRRNHGSPVLPYSTSAVGTREEIIAWQALRYADALIAAMQEPKP